MQKEYLMGSFDNFLSNSNETIPADLKKLLSWMIDRLPLKNSREDYAKVMVDLFDNYLLRLKNLDKASLTYVFTLDGVDEYLQVINDNCSQISAIVKLYSDGRNYEAFDKFVTLMGRDKILWGCLNRTIESGKHSLYRIRKIEPSSKITREDLFHIPLNNRGKVASQRYSSTGYPCLYLGYSINACWEELGRPALNSFMVVSVAQQFAIKLIDLSIPNGISELNSQMEIWKFIMSYPLIAACNVKVNTPENTYKEEYIIPQMLTSYIIDQNARKREKHISWEDIIAIKYSSSHYNTQFGWERKYFTNLAIPVIDVASTYKFCPELSALYYLSDPTCIEYEQIKGELAPIELKGKGAYQNSLFGRLERLLSMRVCKPVKYKL